MYVLFSQGVPYVGKPQAPTGSFFWCFKSSNLLMAPEGHRLRRHHVVILHRGVVKTTTTTPKSKKRAPNNGGFSVVFRGCFFGGIYST